MDYGSNDSSFKGLIVGTRISAMVGLGGLALATVAGANSSSFAWSPPIGIPAPSFGIHEIAPAVPAPWLTATPRFYYVDKSSSAATDSGNPYGTPARPRRTIPLALPAGAVVELHGSYDVSHNSPRGIVMRGTAAAPVFVRGAHDRPKPVITGYWEVSGSYFILENLEFGARGTHAGRSQLYILGPTDLATLRFSDVHGASDHGGIGVRGYTTNPVSNMVIHSNTIHDNGDVNATFDQDVHGISVGAFVNNLWILDNDISRNSGDGIQINAGRANQATTHHIYVGRNRSHHNKQTGMWTKQAVDVIFSQNTIYAHRPSNSSSGACAGFQYAPERVWFLFNRVFDCDYGIATGSDSGLGFGSEAYFIGNVIYNIHHSGTYNTRTGWTNAAISLPGGVKRYVVNNTIFDVDGGIASPGSAGTVYMANNIISGVTEPHGAHIFLEMASLARASTMHHNLIDHPVRIKWGSGFVYTLPSFQIGFPGQGVGTSSNAPLFVDPAASDFRLRAGSSAIDAGVSDSVYERFRVLYLRDVSRDAAGMVRPQGSGYDIGAYEFGVGDAAAAR